MNWTQLFHVYQSSYGVSWTPWLSMTTCMIILKGRNWTIWTQFLWHQGMMKTIWLLTAYPAVWIEDFQAALENCVAVTVQSKQSCLLRPGENKQDLWLKILHSSVFDKIWKRDMFAILYLWLIEFWHLLAMRLPKLDWIWWGIGMTWMMVWLVAWMRRRMCLCLFKHILWSLT